MSLSPVPKRASLIATAITLVVVPIGMLIAVAPSSDDASKGFVDLELTSSGAAVGAAAVLIVFGLCFALVALAMTKARSARPRPR